MPPTLADRLIHILRSVDVIQQLLVGQTIETFRDNLHMRLIIERSFEIISEASRRLSDEVKTAHPEIDWAGIASLGNELRHAYHRIDVNILWEISRRDLPPLRVFAEQVLGDEKS
jgi:uncharacterized protein with HEPN domain